MFAAGGYNSVAARSAQLVEHLTGIPRVKGSTHNPVQMTPFDCYSACNAQLHETFQTSNPLTKHPDKDLKQTHCRKYQIIINIINYIMQFDTTAYKPTCITKIV